VCACVCTCVCACLTLCACVCACVHDLNPNRLNWIISDYFQCPEQGCFIRSFGKFNTRIIRLFLKQFWECQFLTQNEPNSPPNFPKSFQFSFNNSNVLIYYTMAYGSLL